MSPVSVVAPALAAGGALLLFSARAVSADLDAEPLFVLLWLTGWTLLAWSAVLTSVGAVALVQRLAARRAVLIGMLSVGAAVAVIVLTALAIPPAGTGGATG